MERFVFNKFNISLLALGLVLLIAGYSLMAAGDRSLCVIMLIISYVVVIPAGLVAGYVAAKRRHSN